jgi:hypothetical protein
MRPDGERSPAIGPQPFVQARHCSGMDGQVMNRQAGKGLGRAADVAEAQDDGTGGVDPYRLGDDFEGRVAASCRLKKTTSPTWAPPALTDT